MNFGTWVKFRIMKAWNQHLMETFDLESEYWMDEVVVNIGEFDIYRVSDYDPNAPIKHITLKDEDLNDGDRSTCHNIVSLVDRGEIGGLDGSDYRISVNCDTVVDVSRIVRPKEDVQYRTTNGTSNSISLVDTDSSIGRTFLTDTNNGEKLTIIEDLDKQTFLLEDDPYFI